MIELVVPPGFAYQLILYFDRVEFDDGHALAYSVQSLDDLVANEDIFDVKMPQQRRYSILGIHQAYNFRETQSDRQSQARIRLVLLEIVDYLRTIH